MARTPEPHLTCVYRPAKYENSKAKRKDDKIMQSEGSRIARREALVFLGKYGTIMWLLVMIAVFSILLPAFRSVNNVMNVLGQIAILSIMAAGMTCCLKMGDFDLSIGANAAITGVVVAKVLVSSASIPLAVLSGLGTGLLIGLVNGFFVAYVGLPPFVCTLATMSIILGAGMSVTKGVAIWGLPEAFEFVGRGDLYGVPIRFILMICLLGIIWFIHTYTPTGRRMEAIGGNAISSRLSGIRVEWHRLLGYLFSGVCAAIAGIVLTSASMSGNPTQGALYLLDAFGAAFIGAATVRLGHFHIWGTLIGVLIVVVAVNGLVILMVPGYFTDMIKGIILLVAIVLSGVAGKLVTSK
jgi:ribose transport system permease protein